MGTYIVSSFMDDFGDLIFPYKLEFNSYSSRYNFIHSYNH